ncbi:hypothetical protein H0H92_000781, partial [Tricholoma furcatifolium]
QSRQAGRNAVTELLRLRETREELKAQIHELTVTLAAELDMLLHDHAEMMTDLRELKNRLKELQATIRRKENVLGVDDHAKLQTLVNSPYIATMVNALAVKQRLRDKLRSRKFELDRVERSFRKQVN